MDYPSCMRYAVKAHRRHDEHNDTFTLQRAMTRKEATEIKAEFLRTRGNEFTRIWIEKTA